MSAVLFDYIDASSAGMAERYLREQLKRSTIDGARRRETDFRAVRDPLLRSLPDAYSLGMFARLMRALGRFLAWVTEVVGQLGGALNGGRSADKYATKLSEQPRDEYRP